MKQQQSLLERFLDKWERDPETECWVWTAYRDTNGYGRMTYQDLPALGHRISFMLLVREPRADRELDHLCDNRACVNPNHLREVTHAENMARMLPTRRTTCKNGHPRIPENRYYTRGRRSSNCRPCQLDGQRRRRAQEA